LRIRVERELGAFGRLAKCLGGVAAAAAQHRQTTPGMKGMVGQPHVRAFSSHRRDRNQRAAHVERQHVARDFLRPLQRLARAITQVRRNQNHRAVAAERERQFAFRTGVDDGDDRGRAGKIDVLVAPGGNGGGRGDDIADSEEPIVRYGDIVAGLERIGKVDDDGGVQDPTVQVLAGPRV
jgi:hypothetical protein